MVEWPKRVESADPLVNKLEEVRHDQRAAGWFAKVDVAGVIEDNFYTDQQAWAVGPIL